MVFPMVGSQDLPFAFQQQFYQHCEQHVPTYADDSFFSLQVLQQNTQQN